MRAIARRRGWTLAACGTVAWLLTLVEAAGAQEPPRQYSAYPLIAEYDVGVRVRDGVRLSADIYRPRDAARHPTLFQLTPYNNNSVNPSAGAQSTSAAIMERAWKVVGRGYAYVMVDARGRYDSEGERNPGPTARWRPWEVPTPV